MMRMSVEAKVVRRSGSALERILTRKVDSGQLQQDQELGRPPDPSQRVVAGLYGGQRQPNEGMPASPGIPHRQIPIRG